MTVWKRLAGEPRAEQIIRAALADSGHLYPGWVAYKDDLSQHEKDCRRLLAVMELPQRAPSLKWWERLERQFEKRKLGAE
jgi:hypothetical protein